MLLNVFETTARLNTEIPLIYPVHQASVGEKRFSIYMDGHEVSGYFSRYISRTMSRLGR